MSEMDFDGYDDVVSYHKYDWFISPDGKYYIVKLRKSDMSGIAIMSGLKSLLKRNLMSQN